jgi:hypothetical protein
MNAQPYVILGFCPLLPCCLCNIRVNINQGYSYVEGVDLSPGAIQAGLEYYMASALNIDELMTDARPTPLEQMVQYQGKPPARYIVASAGDVLLSTSGLVKGKSEGLPLRWREAIFEHVLARYEMDCPEEQPVTEEEEYNKRVEWYKKEYPKIDFTEEEYLAPIRQEVRDNLANAPAPWVNACYDAVCNLLLFTRVLAEHKREHHVVVAFGSQHVTPLYALLTSLNVRTEPGPMTLRY